MIPMRNKRSFIINKNKTCSAAKYDYNIAFCSSIKKLRKNATSCSAHYIKH